MSHLLLRRILGVLVAATLMGGCTYYQVVPAPTGGASVFDRSWNAALGAAADAGVAVSSADRTSGVIRGTTPADDVTIRVYTQADGRVRVEFNATGRSGTDAALAGRLSDAYERRMGR